MKKRWSLHLSPISLLAWLFSAGAVLAGFETVTVSPKNLNKEVKFYSEYAAQMHTLTVRPASGYKFKSGPSLSLNPENLWASTGSNSFSMTDMEDRRQITAMVVGVLVPDGSGGSGTPPEYPFAISMITRYFTMDFIEPTGGTEFIKDEDIPVAVFLINAVGAPASGSVNFSSNLGSFGMNNPATVHSGLAEGTLTVTADGGTKGKITASASEIDITDNKKASGEKESEEFTAWELKFDSLFATSSSNSVPVHYNPSTQEVRLYILQEVFGEVKVLPPDIPNEKAQIRIVQNVISYRDYTYTSPPPGKTKSVSTTGGSRAWDDTFDVNHPDAEHDRHGQGLKIDYSDMPSHGWKNDSNTRWTAMSVNDSFTCYLQVKFTSQDKWKTVGVVTWPFAGSATRNGTNWSGAANALVISTGSASSEEPIYDSPNIHTDFNFQDQ